MFLNSLNRSFKKLGLRISLWYSGILILSGLVLLFTVHFLLSFLFLEKDRESVRAELKHLGEMYSRDGRDAVQKEIAARSGRTGFFIRLADRSGATILSSGISDFEDYDLRQIETLKGQGGGWLTLGEKHEDHGFHLPFGEETLEVAVLQQEDGTVLQIGKSSEDRSDLEQRILFIFGMIMIPLLLAVAAFLSNRALHPLRAMIATVESIQAGKLSSRVPTSGTGDELDELAHLFNAMLERIEKLIKAMQDSLDNVAHDLRTPLTRLRATAETAFQSNGSAESYREALADCMEESEQILSMLETLMDISESQAGRMLLHPEKVSVSKLIEDTIDLYRYVAEDRGLLIEGSCPDDLFVTVDPRRFRQALANLVDNAVKYTESGGRVVLEGRQTDQEALIAVIDTGAGIPSHELPRIWERLYRSDNAQAKKGIGLGLSLVRAIIQSHGGIIEATSELDQGSIFTIHIPLSASELKSSLSEL